jgi:hypothetical protein
MLKQHTLVFRVRNYGYYKTLFVPSDINSTAERLVVSRPQSRHQITKKRLVANNIPRETSEVPKQIDILKYSSGRSIDTYELAAKLEEILSSSSSTFQIFNYTLQFTTLLRKLNHTTADYKLYDVMFDFHREYLRSLTRANRISKLSVDIFSTEKVLSWKALFQEISLVNPKWMSRSESLDYVVELISYSNKLFPIIMPIEDINSAVESFKLKGINLTTTNYQNIMNAIAQSQNSKRVDYVLKWYEEFKMSFPNEKPSVMTYKLMLLSCRMHTFHKIDTYIPGQTNHSKFRPMEVPDEDLSPGTLLNNSEKLDERYKIVWTDIKTFYPQLNTQLYEALIRCLSNFPNANLENYLNEMKSKNIKRNVFIYNAMISSSPGFEVARDYFEEMTKIEKCPPNEDTFCSLLKVAHRSDNISFARDVFQLYQHMYPDAQNLVVYNMYVRVLMKFNLPDLVFDLLKRMKDVNLTPSAITLRQIMTYYADPETFNSKIAQMIYDLFPVYMIERDVNIQRKLLRSFILSEDYDNAERVFLEIIEAFRAQGRGLPSKVSYCFIEMLTFLSKEQSLPYYRSRYMTILELAKAYYGKYLEHATWLESFAK